MELDSLVAIYTVFHIHHSDLQRSYVAASHCSYVPYSNLLFRIQNFEIFTDFYRCLKIFTLEIVKS